MSNEEIEAIINYTIEFVEERGERNDLAKFLRERLSRPTPRAPAAFSGREAVAFLVGLIVGLLVARFGGG